jgi:acetylornithine/succinyldiaminopimelate/putrescine aminotransferase
MADSKKGVRMEKIELVKARGSYYWDSGGKRYLDFTSGGIFQAPFGGQDKGIKQVIAKHGMFSCYGAHYDNPDSRRLIDMLKEWTGYEAVALFSTGSEATEAFWRLCRTYTGKPGIWGGLVDPDEVGETEPAPQPDAMHGWTLGALVMAGKMRLPNPGMFMELGGDYEGKPQDVTGCAIFEPYHAPSAQFHKESPTMDRLRTNMASFPDIHFCCDEIQGGMGRTGKLFAHQWYAPAVKPEFVTIGKMLGGGLPLSALLGPKALLEDLNTLEHANLHSTHSGNPLLSAVGCHVIERMQRESMVERSLELGEVLANCLSYISQRHHCGRGLIAGIEFEGPMMASAVVDACQRRGLLVVDTGRKWVKIGAQLNITFDQVVDGCKILQAAIDEVEDGYSKTRGDQGEASGPGDIDLQNAGVQADGGSGDTKDGQDEGQSGPGGGTV